MIGIQLLFRFVGNLGLFAFDIGIIAFYRVNVALRTEIIRHRILHHNFTADERIHQSIECLFVRIAVAVDIRVSDIEEIGHKVAFQNIFIHAFDDARIGRILAVAFEVVMLRDIYGCDDLRHILFAVGRNQTLSARRRAERECDAQAQYRYLLECVSLLHKPLRFFIVLYLCFRKNIIFPRRDLYQQLIL